MVSPSFVSFGHHPVVALQKLMIFTSRPSTLSPDPQPPQFTTAAPGIPTAEGWYVWVVPQAGYVSDSGERVSAEFIGSLDEAIAFLKARRLHTPTREQCLERGAILGDPRWGFVIVWRGEEV